MAEPSSRNRVPQKLLAIALLLGAGVAIALWQWGTPERPLEKEQSVQVPLPAYSATPFLNASADARYVRSQACAKCHQSNHASYLLTAHSKALSELDPSNSLQKAHWLEKHRRH